MTTSFKAIVAALLLGGSGLAMAANDGQSRANELLSADPQYRETWQGVVKKEERLPEWVMNLSGTAEQMNAVEEDGDKYLVGPLCETADMPEQAPDRRLQPRQGRCLRHVGGSAGWFAVGQVPYTARRLPFYR